MFAQRLKLARKKSGMSLQQLADELSPRITAQAISKYETGKMMPASSVLVGLAKTLNVSLDFLMGGPVQALEGVEFRKRSSTSAKELAKVEALVTEMLEDYLLIENILNITPPSPDFGAPLTQLRDMEDVERAARDLRVQWKLGLDPIASLTALLEDRGIKVIEIDASDRVDGLSAEVTDKNGNYSHLVVVSKTTSTERKRFNLAHELAHHVIRGAVQEKLDLERAMNRFAGAFLMPAEHLIQQVGAKRSGTTYHEIMHLKTLYGVSASAMLMRLAQLKIMQQRVVDYAFRTYARSWRRQEPEPIRAGEGFAAFEKPQRFEKLVWQALGEQLIAPVRAAQLLRQPLAAIEREIRGPRGA